MILKGMVLMIITCSLSGILGGCDAGINSKNITIVKDLQAQMPIFIALNPLPVELRAANELALYIKRISGAQVEIRSEYTAAPEEKGIYVGQTVFAEKNGINYHELGDEEWIIRTVDGNLILSGGRPRGSIYAVYEFLQSNLGIRWFDWSTEYVPTYSSISIPKLDIREEPAYWGRAIYNAVNWFPYGVNPSAENQERFYRYYVSNKINNYGWPEEWGGGRLRGSGGAFHNLFEYLPPKEFFAEHPEYYSLIRNKRVDAAQVCFTNPDVRDIFKKRLRENIIKDRQTYGSSNYPRLYEISVRDTIEYCECPSCRSVVEEDGGRYSALILNFINDIAGSIATDYPDIFIQTLAYTDTIEPPESVKPADNIIMRFADYRGETCRPLTHPHNNLSYQYLQKWDDITSADLAAWDYQIPYGSVPLLHPPTANVRVISQDIKTLYENSVRSIFIESEKVFTTSFHSLRMWLAAKLLSRPDLDAEILVHDFLQGYYGPAADIMHDYLNYLEAAVEDTDQRIERRYPDSNIGNFMLNAPYVTLDYLVACNEFLNKAENLCEGDSSYAQHIRQEQIPVLNSILILWDRFERELKPSETMPFDREDLIEMYNIYRREQQEIWQETGIRPYYRTPDVKENLNLEVEAFRAQSQHPPVPEKFADTPEERIIDIFWPEISLNNWGPSISRIIADPDAAGGKALATVITPWLSGAVNVTLRERFNSAWTIGKTITAEEYSTVDGYKLYHIGECAIEPSLTNFYVWLDLFCDSGRQGKIYNIYFSLKILPEAKNFKALAWTGTAPYSQERISARVLCDRIILVEKE